jgi:hypothetical protein
MYSQHSGPYRQTAVVRDALDAWSRTRHPPKAQSQEASEAERTKDPKDAARLQRGGRCVSRTHRSRSQPQHSTQRLQDLPPRTRTSAKAHSLCARCPLSRVGQQTRETANRPPAHRRAVLWESEVTGQGTGQTALARLGLRTVATFENSYLLWL